MDEAVSTDDLVEVEHSRPFALVTKRCDGAIELSLERLPFAGPRGRTDMFEPSLHDKLCEAGERDVVEVQIPSHGKLSEPAASA